MLPFAWSDFYRGDLEWLPPSTILLTRHGSHAYGLNTETSDLDVKGVCIPPRRYFTGFLHRFEQAESRDPDLTIFDIRKFMQLAADCNPNIIEILWTDPEDWFLMTDAGQALVNRRGDFLSTKAKHTFSGYAVAQLKRIRTHRKWLLNPPKGQPARADFGLPETSVLSADQRGAIEALGENAINEFPMNVMEVYAKERAYANAKREWEQFQNWRKTRNPVRADLEAKYGYDCKHAMHLVRLLRMCREILETGRVHVKRPDRDELLAIRNGAWEYDQLVEWAERQDKELDEVKERSPLPKQPNRNKLDELCRYLVEENMLDEQGFIRA